VTQRMGDPGYAPRKRAYAGLFVALATLASLLGIGLAAQPAFRRPTATVRNRYRVPAGEPSIPAAQVL